MSVLEEILGSLKSTVHDQDFTYCSYLSAVVLQCLFQVNLDYKYAAMPKGVELHCYPDTYRYVIQGAIQYVIQPIN